MSISLKKGDKAFVVTKAGITRSDNDFVFYNNLKHPSGGVIHSGDNLTGFGEGDDEVIKVALEKLPKYADRVVFCVTIFEAERRMQNFGMVENSYIRIVDDVTGNEITISKRSSEILQLSLLVKFIVMNQNGSFMQ